MRRCLSIMLLTCFMLISGSVSYVTSYAHILPDDGTWSQAAIENVDERSPVSSLTIQFDEHNKEKSKDECPCKKESGATKFVCSVTLAFASDAAVLHAPVQSKMRYAIFKSNALQSFVDQLKRPPRNIL